MDLAASALVEKLAAEGSPFVRATVVRAQPPAPAHAGDTAVVLPDGSVVGFVGGRCVESSVRAAALAALDEGAPLLLRVVPAGGSGFPEVPGARVAVNPCLSGGALEIFLEPQLPAPVVAVVGETPIARAVVAMAESVGFAAFAAFAAGSLVDRPPFGARAVVVASHGHDEEQSIRAALDAGAAYVGLVASRRRGAAVVETMGLSADERSRVHTPAGIDIGARTPPEVALSILAQVVAELRRPQGARGQATGATDEMAPPAVVAAGAVPAATASVLAGAVDPVCGMAVAAAGAVDPVCGMAVAVGPHTPHCTIEGRDLWFCSAGCRDAFCA